MPNWRRLREGIVSGVVGAIRSRPTAILLIALATAAAIAFFLGSYPDEVPAKSDPGFIDNIFASRFVVFMARLALVALGAYVVLSMAALIWSRRWLSQVGPGGVKVDDISQSIAEYEQRNRVLTDELAEAGETIEDLQRGLEESNEVLESLQEDYDDLVEQLATLRGEH